MQISKLRRYVQDRVRNALRRVLKPYVEEMLEEVMMEIASEQGCRTGAVPKVEAPEGYVLVRRGPPMDQYDVN